MIILSRSPVGFQVWILLTVSEYRGWFFDLLSRLLGLSLYFHILSKFSAFFLISLLLNLFMCDSLNHPLINSVKSVLQNVHFYHSSLKSVLQSFYFPPELLSKPSRELACKNREFSHCFHERCYITTQQDYCSLFSFILVTLTDLLCIVSAVAFFHLNFIHCCGYLLSFGDIR